MRLRGERVVIRPMRRKDLEAMTRWRPFADPLYQPFDFPRQDLAQHIRWFSDRKQDPTRRLYTIEDEQGAVIGSLTLRDMDGRRSARLGITLGADYVSRGYGTEALRLFLDYYFDELGFSQMVLDVAATNLRALRAYRALGFRHTGHHFRAATHSSYATVLRDTRYRHLHRLFQRRGAWPEVMFHDMILTRGEWEAQRQGPPDNDDAA